MRDTPVKLLFVYITLLTVAVSMSHSQQLTGKDLAIGRVSIGGSAMQVRKLLGKPLTIETWYDPETDPDSGILYNYKGLKVLLGPRDKIEGLEIVSHSYKTRRGASVGIRRSAILKSYGTPAESDSTYAQYEDGKGGGIIFSFKDNVVIKIYIGGFSD